VLSVVARSRTDAGFDPPARFGDDVDGRNDRAPACSSIRQTEPRGFPQGSTLRRDYSSSRRGRRTTPPTREDQEEFDMQRLTTLAAIAAAAITAQGATAGTISITVENIGPAGGFSLTPFWLATHDGSFTTFQSGTMASGWAGLTEVAEEGNTGPLSNRFAMSPAGMAGGSQGTLLQPDGAPVFSPGESATFNMAIGNPLANRYFSYASMVVPSNDLFIGNANGMAYEIFDASGKFNGPVEILVYGSMVYDNGSEVNNAFGGAAFSTNGGNSVDEFENIRPFFTSPGDAGYLASFLGTGTADGGTITSTFGPDDVIARITIVPAPPVLLAALPLAFLGRRRRRPA